MTSPPIQWYPGHIAKAERALQEQLKKVDVVLEVRDARIPLATRHPDVAQWISGKERVLILNRVDMIPQSVQQDWNKWFRSQNEVPYFTNAHQGQGISGVAQAARQVGAKINQRRSDRGMLPRPVRAVVIGFPNVGKSALINRLLKKRVVESARRAGVTRQLKWVRISDELDLLDAPGVLPSRLSDQEAALKLAFCDDIGQAAYDNQRVAAALVDRIKAVYHLSPNLFEQEPLSDRYPLELEPRTGEGFVADLADIRYQGDKERSANQILNDFRKGILGAIPLELPPAIE
ncbi:ribosome biogenesis GTPase YlqF [Leptolyngbya ohadii]|uniref:ribosome biogenesis GTPase YlqF n=1 Tax=Leptolyngbya ohadii TaxID=1962290 RepID=UPI000B59EE97|nr:ribosome biogenesis GTPase YlqF [Leptolyngbya ohadii]